MHGPSECHTESSKSNREGEIPYDIPYMWTLKRNDTNGLTKQRLTENELMVVEGGGKGPVREFGMDMPHTAVLKVSSQRGLTVKPGGLCSVLRGSPDGRKPGENGYMHMYG